MPHTRANRRQFQTALDFAQNRAFRQRFRLRVIMPAVVVLLTLAGLAFAGIRLAGSNVDEIAAQGQKWEALRAVGRSLDELALAQETVGVCRSCLTAADDPVRNRAWLDEHIGVPLHELYRAHENYILSPQGEAIYAFGAQSAGRRPKFDLVRTDVMSILSRARGDLRGAATHNERLPNTAVQPYTSARTHADTIHATVPALIRGRPALVSAMQMQRAAAGPSDGGSLPFLVSIRYLDKAWVTEIGERNFLDQPRISFTGVADPHERSVPIRAADGATVAWLIWRPMLPGALLRDALAAWAWAGLALFLALLGMLAWGVRLLMLKDETRIAALRKAHMELTASEAQAHHLAYHDVLTGLPNRSLFNETVEKALLGCTPQNPMAILLLDLDRFKHINDRLGHLAGDALIEEVARRISVQMCDGEMVARLGGDEFALLLRRQRFGQSIQTRLATLIEEVRRPFELLGNQAHVGASIGVVLAPANGTDRTDLMRKADIALYRAKGEGRDCFRMFDQSMDETVQLRATLETDLRAALEHGRGFAVHYQPQVDARTRRVTGLEALLRWDHAERGSVPPALFVPVAEETGLIAALGEYVLRHACRVAQAHPDLTIAVNLSPNQFREEGLPDRIAAIVRSAGVDPLQIELEVTEGVLMDDSDMVRDALRRLRGMGFGIALDDFGTGYSSLSYLRKFEVDRIKIDKSFVQRLGTSHEAGAIITAVITLGHAMGLAITAEGVETEEQEEFLREAGCTQLQGYLFSAAIPAAQIRLASEGGAALAA